MSYKNPFTPIYGYGGYVPPYPPPMPSMVPPEKFKSEMLERLQPQLDQYGRYYQQSQAQMQLQENSGLYYKVTSYEEVKNITPPADGRPVMVFDEANGRLYSKRFSEGQTYIKGFGLVEIEDASETPPATEAKTSESGAKPEDDVLKAILDKLDGFDKRLSAMEGKGE